MPPAARFGDLHTCPQQIPGTPPVPHVGGPIQSGMPTVLIGGQPAARVGDLAVCVGPPSCIVKGSATVMIGGMPAARIGDSTAHGGTVSSGCPTVLIGDAGAGGGGAVGSATASIVDSALFDGSAQAATMAAARTLGAPIARRGCQRTRQGSGRGTRRRNAR